LDKKQRTFISKLNRKQKKRDDEDVSSHTRVSANTNEQE